MITITESEPPLSEDDIAALERQLGASLPESYRRFLLENNGGRPEPDVVHIEGLPGGATDIHFFFGINDPTESNNILWNVESCSGRIPDKFLPIASDSGGSRFCLSLSGSDRGSIVFCLLTFTEDDGTIFFVASDFDNFLDKIVPLEPASALN